MINKQRLKVTVLPLVVFVLWATLFDHVPPSHIGVAYNSWSGQITVQQKPGWYVTSPLTFVMRIDTKPMRVTIITTANVIVSKLVQFKQEGVNDFLQRQGFGYMFPYRQKLIMVGYAYSGKQYRFLGVLEDPDTPPPQRAP